jgi:hypothetical protein
MTTKRTEGAPSSSDKMGDQEKPNRALLVLGDEVIFDSENPDAEGLEDGLYREYKRIFDAKRKARADAKAATKK